MNIYIVVLICQLLCKSCTCNSSLNPQNNPKKELLLLSIPILHMRLLGQSNIKKHIQARVSIKELGKVCAVRK